MLMTPVALLFYLFVGMTVIQLFYYLFFFSRVAWFRPGSKEHSRSSLFP